MLTGFKQFVASNFRAFSTCPEALALSRILFGVSLLMLGQPDFVQIAGFDPMFYNPPPRLDWLPMSFDTEFWNTVQLTSLFSLFAFTLGFLTPVSSFVYFGATLYGFSKLYAFGKIDHNFFTVLTPLLLGLSGCGAKWSVDAWIFKNTKTKSWPITYLAFCLGLAFLTAALPKIAGGWLNPGLLMSKGFIAKKVLHEGFESPVANWLINCEWNWLFKFLDYATLAVELVFVVLVFHKKWAVLALSAVCIFHVGVLLMMGINFSGHMLAYVPLLLCLTDEARLKWFLNQRIWLAFFFFVLSVLNFFYMAIVWISLFSILVSVNFLNPRK